jgi:hypothetical protein
MEVIAIIEEPVGRVELVHRPRFRGVRWFVKILGRIAGVFEYFFGMISLILGLAILAALPIFQFLSLGYMLEASGRVGRSGRLRDGLIGVRQAARVGGFVAGIWLVCLPSWLVRSMAQSAETIDPGGRVAQGWRIAVGIVGLLTFLHITITGLRGGRLRTFLWPIGHVFWLFRLREVSYIYKKARDDFWDFVVSLRIPRLFRLGLIGFLGTLAWLIIPAFLIATTPRLPFLGALGVFLLALIVPFLPFLQVRFAVEGKASALLAVRAVRESFRRAPWAFAFALMVMLTASIPLYLLKLEMIPPEAAWLPSLVFVLFLFPARLLAGWAYARSSRRETRRHWFFRILGRVAIIPVALLYVLVVFLAQYTSWGGASSLFEQHAFLLPVPFLGM